MVCLIYINMMKRDAQNESFRAFGSLSKVPMNAVGCVRIVTGIAYVRMCVYTMSRVPYNEVVTSMSFDANHDRSCRNEFRARIRCQVKKIITGENIRLPYRKDVNSYRRYILYRKYVDPFLFVVSIAYLLLAIFETPRYGQDPPHRLNFVEISIIEGIFLSIFILDAVTESSFRLANIFNLSEWIAWARADRWTGFKFILIVFTFFDYVLWVATPLPIRISVFARPVFVVCRKSWMKSVSRAAFHSILSSASVIVLLMVHLFWFACAGFWIFHAEKYKSNLVAPREDHEICDVFSRNGCTDYFHSIPEALYTMFVTLTTVNFPDVMIPYFEVGGWYAFVAAAYFLLFYIIGLYFLMNLLLATIYNGFRSRTKASVVEKTGTRKFWLERTWAVVTEHFGVPATGHLTTAQFVEVYRIVHPKVSDEIAQLVVCAVEANRREGSRDDGTSRSLDHRRLEAKEAEIAITSEDFLRSWQFFVLRVARRSVLLAHEDASTTPSAIGTWTQCGNRARTFVSFRHFERISDVLVICNAIVVSVLLATGPGSSDDATFALKIVAILLLTYFVFEMVLRVTASGGIARFWAEHTDRPFVRIDSVAVAISVISIVLGYTVAPNLPECGTIHNPCSANLVDETTLLIKRLLGTLQLLRMLRLIRFFQREFRVAVRIVRALSIYLIWFFCALYPWIILGNVSFATSLRSEDERVRASVYGETHKYYELNFNTFLSSFVVLWYQLVVNNWPIVAAGCVATSGRIARLYFVGFHVYAVLMVLNILISIIIEVYGVVYERAGSLERKSNWRRVIDAGARRMGAKGATVLRTFKFSMPTTTGSLVRNVFIDGVPEGLRPLLRLDTHSD